MKGVVWDVRVAVETSAGTAWNPDPVTTVVAEGWYEARALAAAQLNVDKKRLHVSQRTPPKFDLPVCPRCGRCVLAGPPCCRP